VACILCVDDDEDVLKWLGEVLQNSGYSTLTALSGNQGLRLLLQNPVDLVVLDYEMPGMNGNLAAQAIHRTKPELPIILFTGKPDDIPDSARKNVNAVVYKADSRGLLALVGRLIMKT
jgi:CheY-like chemotaxis protein